jgi:hypothetical protein
MLLPALDGSRFQVLLDSAKRGSRLNLTSALFCLSREQLKQLLEEGRKTQNGRLIIRGEDYDQYLLVELSLRYGPNLDIVWSTPTSL